MHGPAPLPPCSLPPFGMHCKPVAVAKRQTPGTPIANPSQGGREGGIHNLKRVLINLSGIRAEEALSAGEAAEGRSQHVVARQLSVRGCGSETRGRGQRVGAGSGTGRLCQQGGSHHSQLGREAMAAAPGKP